MLSPDKKEEVEKHPLKRTWLIHELVRFLTDQAGKGATHVEISWSGDPHWPFEWLTSFRELSDAEVKGKKINKLLKEIQKINKE